MCKAAVSKYLYGAGNSLCPLNVLAIGKKGFPVVHVWQLFGLDGLGKDGMLSRKF